MHGFIRIITGKKEKKWSRCVKISVLALYSACRAGGEQLIRTAKGSAEKKCGVTKVEELIEDLY